MIPVRASDLSRRSVAAYQRSVEKAIAGRRPLAVFIDEAQNTCKVGSGRAQLDHLNVIKTMANTSNTPHVLVGTYDLLAFRQLNGQVARRCCLEFHLQRYKADIEIEVRQFQKVVRSFCTKMPFQEPPELTGHMEYIFERSIGCVGVLKDWLQRAIMVALDRDSKSLTIKDLEKTQLSISAVKKLLDECTQGEMKVQENDSDKKYVREVLRFKPLAFLPPATFENGKSLSGAAIVTKAKVKPFKRMPKRDPVEEGTYGAA
jgi:hypothetical protein